MIQYTKKDTFSINKTALCHFTGDNLKLFNSTMTWDNASKSCTDKNMTLAKLDKNDVDKREFKNLSLMEGNLYWIGLRRFLFRVELGEF